MFIVLEGLDGAGTTTQVELLSRALRARGVSTLTTCEPSSGPIGSLLRQALQKRVVQPGREGLDAHTMALLFAADRIDHLRAEVEPALAAGRVVISDRYAHSSLAYQGASLDPCWIHEINVHARTADLVIWLDVPLEVCLQRIASRGMERELFEQEDTLRSVAAGYERAMALRDDPVARIDGVGTPQEVSARILSAVDRHRTPLS